jgi:hypothetical protein
VAASHARSLSPIALALGIAAACGRFDGADNDRRQDPAGSSGATGPVVGADGSADALGTVGKDGAPLGPDAARPSLRCGTKTCTTTPCCVEETGSSSPPYAFDCVDACPTKPKTAALDCTDTSSCSGGQVCCVSVASDHATARCQARPCSSGAQMCDPKTATTAKECEPGKVCSTSDMDNFFLDSTYGKCKSP